MSRLEQTAWTPSTTEGRWCGFGPYYAMFPVEFVRRVVSDFCPAKGRVLDPFCGRGATPFVALATGREALAAEINPVGWIYTAVKLDPCKRVMALMDRVHEVLESSARRTGLRKMISNARLGTHRC